jgi:MFS family permease
LLGIILAIPYGLLADRIGRKPTIYLSIPGFALNILITAVVLWFSNIFPLRFIWLGSLAWLFGGGLVVASAIIWTMMADVTTESERYWQIIGLVAPSGMDTDYTMIHSRLIVV